MCNLYRLEKGAEAIKRAFGTRNVPITFSEGIPNFQPRDIRITDPAPIVRHAAEGAGLVTRRWSWPGAASRYTLAISNSCASMLSARSFRSRCCDSSRARSAASSAVCASITTTTSS